MHWGSRSLTLGLAAIAILVWAHVAYAQIATEDHGVHRTRNMLVTSNRERLDICVDSLVLGASAADARSLVFDAVTQVRKHPLFGPAGLDGAEPVVTAGCSAPANLGAPHWDSKLGAAPQVDVPSPHRLFVFIAEADALARAFGSRLPRTTAQEIYCEDDDCSEVTTALYVTAEELRNPTVLVDALVHGVGLLPPNTGDESAPPPGSQK